MISQLTLKNFRKHEALELNFENGLVVFRGRNEAGKSSIFQGVNYAMFGTKALSQPLDEVVTYGKPAAALWAGLALTIDGVDYRLQRSKAGAELTYPGGIVTGQTEVTRKIEELVGAPAALASSLWFSNQGSIRGALADGSKAATSLIEKLADFGAVDRLIELIQEGLTVGPTKQYEDRLEQARATLASIGEPTAPPDAAEEIARLLEAEERAAAGAKEVRQHLREFIAGPLKDAQSRHDAHRLAEDRLTRAKAARASLVSEKEALKPIDYNSVKHARIKQLVEAGAGAAARAQEARKARRAYEALPPILSCWEGDGASFLAFIEVTEQGLVTAQARYGVLLAARTNQLASLREGSCGICGLDYDSVAAVGAANKATRANVERLDRELAQAQATQKEAEQASKAIRVIHTQWQAYRDFLAKFEGFVKVGAPQVPPKLEWLTQPAEDADYPALVKQLEEVEKLRTAALRAQGKVEALEGQLTAAQEAVKGAEAAARPLADAPQVLKESQKTAESMEALQNEASEFAAQATARRAAAQNEAKQAQALYEERRRTYALATEQAAQAQAMLEEVTFNNVLLKKVRSARPAIIDRLWATLLATIGHYFSMMRGESSAVTRVEGAFLVDGRPVEGLSGSTLDVLGLAIRVALLKTFLPRCSFLVLDEPAAACDEEREAALIGTIATAQFGQVILVTHSGIADAYSNQLVTL